MADQKARARCKELGIGFPRNPLGADQAPAVVNKRDSEIRIKALKMLEEQSYCVSGVTKQCFISS
jgi:hypothetical protein